MTSEAQVLATRRNTQSPPPRHRDDPKLADEYGFDLILRALCVSVVTSSQEGHTGYGLSCDPMTANDAKQSQFPQTRIHSNAFTGKGL